MRRLLAPTILAALAASASPAPAAYSLTTTTVTEDFNGLIASGDRVVSDERNVQGPISGTGFVGTFVGGTQGASGTNNLEILANAGGSPNGGLYSYGATNSTDRALGSLASVSFFPAFGAQFVNNTGSTLTSFTLSFDREVWRSSTVAQNRLAFAYGVTSTAIGADNFLSASGRV